MVAEPTDARTVDLHALAWVVKARWEKRLGLPLDIHVETLMPGCPDYRADIALVDPSTNRVKVVVEVKGEAGSRLGNRLGDLSGAHEQLERLLESVKRITAVEDPGGDPAHVVLLVPRRQKSEAEHIVGDLGNGQVTVEAW